MLILKFIFIGYKLIDFAPIVVLLNTLLHKKPKETTSTVRNKYSHAIFHKVTAIPLMDINTLFDKYPEITEKFATTPLTYQTVVATCSSSSLSDSESSKKAAKKYYQTATIKFPPKSMPLPFIR